MKPILLLTFLLAVFTKNVKAQHKIAFVYFDSVLMMMPEKMKADSIIQDTGKYYETGLEKLQKEYILVRNEFEDRIYHIGKEGKSLSDFYNKKLDSIYRLITEKQIDAQASFPIIKQNLYEPIIKKAQKAIAEVAIEKGYTYVLDASIGVILYFSPTDNILADVKKKLGIK